MGMGNRFVISSDSEKSIIQPTLLRLLSNFVSIITPFQGLYKIIQSQLGSPTPGFRPSDFTLGYGYIVAPRLRLSWKDKVLSAQGEAKRNPGY
jgi:hypothetical protein